MLADDEAIHTILRVRAHILRMLRYMNSSFLTLTQFMISPVLSCSWGSCSLMLFLSFQVRWVPDVGKNRIRAFVEGRGDWCISRQRSWGVPIPVFYDRATGKDFLLNQETLEHIQQLFAEHGSDCWWTMEESELLPASYKDEADKWRKGTDTMDVWFDSGSSWAGVAQSREELAYPADIYLEGSDQHRGWFQSSLLTSVANNNQAPYKTVLTHGFVLDEKGFKMSKSLGNVVDPMQGKHTH